MNSVTSDAKCSHVPSKLLRDEKEKSDWQMNQSEMFTGTENTKQTVKFSGPRMSKNTQCPISGSLTVQYRR